jgi:alkaline phosphatase
VNSQVADSACTSTAYQCGVKNNKGTIGVNANVLRYHCDSGLNQDYHVRSIGDWATAAGKDIGLVTTTRVTHASPVGLYGKIANRDWENDAEVLKDGCDSSKVDDIAEQLVHGDTGLRLKVVFGGGRRNFLNSTVRDEEGEKGKRLDGKNLIDEWKNLPIGNRTYIWNKQQLNDLDMAGTDHVLGLFASSHCPYQLEVNNDGLQDEKPTLAEMVDKAIEILSKNPNGFYLFVEGGRIDHAHHDNYARHSLEETVQFSKAIDLATNKLNSSETLFVVTADHSHALSYAGYSKRGNDVLSVTDGIAGDNMKYKTLNYGNGPGYYVNFNQTEGMRVNPEELDQFSYTLRHPGTIPLIQDTHGGDDVGIYALGPYSHLFEGVIEQHMIPHIMAYAACIGDGLTACK